MADPNSMKALVNTGAKLCSGRPEDTKCLLKAIAIASAGTWNEKWAGPDSLHNHIPLYDDPEHGFFFFRAFGNLGSADWDEIDTLDLRYHRGNSGGVYNPLLTFNVYSMPGK